MTKFRRKVLAMVLTVAMILSTVSMAFAADNSTNPYEESAKVLQEYGVMVGDNGDLMLDKQLKRQDAVIISLRLMGIADEEFENYEYDSDFSDIADAYYLPIIGMAQDLGLVEGMGDGTFGFNNLIKAQDVQTLLLRALGYEITDEIYPTVPEMAKEIGIADLVDVDKDELITRDIVAHLMLNTLNTNVKDGDQTLGEMLGYTDPVDPEPEELEITAKVATEDSVVVTFNRAVEDTSAISFELKGTTTVETEAAWNEEATEATLTAPSTLLEGVYTLTVTGDNFAEGKNVATLNVVENGIATIEIVGDKLVKIDDSNATIGYKLLDKYGVDITEDTVSESDLDIASSKTLNADKFDLDNEKGIMTVKFAANELKDVETVALTLIATKSGAAISKTLEVADPAQVNEIKLSGIEFEDEDTTKILTGESKAAYITLEATDQYGTEITSATDLAADGSGEVLYVVSDSQIILTAEEYTDDNDDTKVRLIVDTTALTVEKTVTVTAVSKLSGKSASITLDIKEPAKPDKVSVGSLETIVAANDPADTFVLPLIVLDQEGVQLTNDEIASKASDFTITATGALNGKLAIATSGEHKGKLVNNAQLGATEGTAVVTISTSTDVATYTVDVEEAAYEKTIKVDSEPASNLLMGATTKMNFKFVDQYGREMDSPAAGTKVTIEVSDTKVLLATSASDNTGNNNPYDSNAAELAADDALAITTATDEGSSKVTARLYDQAGTSVISKVEKSISVTDGVPGTLTFEIEDVPTLMALTNGSGDGTVDGNDAYARPLKLVAKDANGKTYAIPSNRILSVTTTDTDLILLSANDQVNGTIDAQDGYYVVAAKEIAVTSQFGDDDTKTATVKFVISTDDGVREVTKDITVAKEQPKVTKIVFTDTAIPAANPYELATDAKEITEITGTTADVTAQKIYVYEVDQYGVYKNVAAPTFTVVNMDRFSGSIGYAANQLSFNKEQIVDEKDVYVMYQAANGVYGTFTINANDGLSDLDASAPTFTAAATQTNATLILANAGVNKEITITAAAETADYTGAFGNQLTVEIVGISVDGVADPLAATRTGNAITVKLADDALDALVDASNTATLVAAAIDSIDGVTATVTNGDGSAFYQAGDVAGPTNLTGGQDVVVLTFNEALDATTIDAADVNTDFAFDNGGAVVVTGTGVLSNGNATYTMTITSADKNIEASTVAAKATQVKDLAKNSVATTAVNVD